MESAIDRWKSSNPWEQERIDILQQVLKEGTEKQLYNEIEQGEFGGEKDEFLIYAHYCHLIHRISLTLIKILFFSSIFLSLFYYIMIIFLSAQGETYTPSAEVYKLIYSVTILIPFSFYLFFRKSTKTIYITNKNIYIGTKNTDEYKAVKLKKISLYGMYIKHSMYPSFKKNKDILLMPFYLNIIKDNKKLFKIFILDNPEFINEKYNISENKNNIINVLRVISYISRIYNIPIYIDQMHYGFACDTKKYIYSSFDFIHMNPFNPVADLYQNIERKFSSAIDLERYLINIKEHDGLNVKKIISILQKKYISNDDELCKITSKTMVFGKKYHICLNKNNIWVEYNGKIIMEKFYVQNIQIYDSNKYFIFVFPCKEKKIPFYCFKKDINFPFIDIFELIYNIKILCMGGYFIEWES
jgi:hypothetical protein